MKHSFRRALLGLVLVLAIAGCSSAGQSPAGPAATGSTGSTGSTVAGSPDAPTAPAGTASPSPTPAPTPACSLRLGVAGLIPAHYPSPSTADWTAMYRSLPDTGGLLGVYTNWADSAAAEGSIPGVVKAAYAGAATYGYTPFVGLGFARDAAGGKVVATVDWADAAQKARAIAAVVAVASTYKPGFLALGIEVNRLYESDPKAFDAFVAGYAEMYDRAKTASPDTLVFPVFQLEMTRGKAYLMGGKRSPEWSLLDRFAGKMDAAAFTTYPFFDAQSPADLPADTFSEIATHADLPVVFTEIGWPSAPLANAPKSGYGGTPEEQSAFVSRFFELTAGIDLRAALWSFPNDLNADFPNTAMRAVSLRTNDGTPKPGLAIWERRAANPCRG